MTIPISPTFRFISRQERNCYLAQEASVFRNMSVEDNIKAVLELSKFSKAEQAERTENTPYRIRPAKMRKQGITLSGGEEEPR